VNAGQILAIVTVDARTSSGELTAGESLVALERQITILKSQATILERALELETTRLKESLSKAGDEAIQLAEQERLQTGIVASSEKLVEVIQPLVEQGVISRLEHERRKQALLQERQKYHQLNQSITQNSGQRRQFEIQLDKALTDSEKQTSDLRATLESLEQQRSKLKADVNYAVTAPASGRISALRAAEGKSIDPKIPLLAILPVDAVFEAELYVAARAIGFIDAGQTVRLMYDAFPYRRFGTFRGKITQIAKSILNPADMDAPIKLEEATYQVRVELDDQAVSAYGLVIPLQAGMSLQASVVLERRSFVGLLIEPLRAVRARS
jgi:membrane fusion protein